MRDKIGLLGGTFNPVHKGHVKLGLNILDAFGLDKIFYILSANPPHKNSTNLAPVAIRWEMLKCALHSFSRLIPCDIEMNRPTYSWTWQTIKELKEEHRDSQFYFISGSEGFLKIKTWKKYGYLLETLPFIVVLRHRQDENKVTKLLQGEGIVPASRERAGEKMPCICLHAYDAEELSISSTKIRNMIHNSIPVTRFVDQGVLKIMEENKLYES